MGQGAYLTGFGNEFATEALKGALPKGQNSPQRSPYGLYPEQFSGSAFTAPRGENRRTWFYRIRPSIMHGEYTKLDSPLFGTGAFEGSDGSNPNQFRWDPLPYPTKPTHFVQGLVTWLDNGSVAGLSGSAVHLYAATESMKDSFFYSADGEMLIVPQEGDLELRTECGVLEVSPGWVACIPRGMKFSAQLGGDKARGYVCENYGAPFRLPGLGPIGANGLANPRDFETPVASYEDREGDFEVLTKFQGALWRASVEHSPLDVVAWHGNLAPYRYDLSLFNAVNTVSFDHPDPSIFTVLTSPTDAAGVANVDFVIFPPRWMVAEKTFRPPYYHRNIMSEYMGLIHGVYDAKADGFVPGGGSLHNCMSAHGPDAATFEAATEAELKPVYQGDTLAFMFESSLPFRTSDFALETSLRQKDYLSCWKGLKKHFDPKKI